MRAKHEKAKLAARQRCCRRQKAGGQTDWVHLDRRASSENTSGHRESKWVDKRRTSTYTSTVISRFVTFLFVTHGVYGMPKWPDADLDRNVQNSSFCEHEPSKTNDSPRTMICVYAGMPIWHICICAGRELSKDFQSDAVQQLRKVRLTLSLTLGVNGCRQASWWAGRASSDLEANRIHG